MNFLMKNFWDLLLVILMYNNDQIDYHEIETIFKDNIVDKENIHEGLQKIISEVDSNHNGKISFDEFCSVMRKMLI